MKLFAVLALEAEQRLHEFNPQQLANTAWAFATKGHSEHKLFEALAREIQQQPSAFNAQERANLAWAFATAHGPVPAVLEPIAVLEAIAAQGTEPQVNVYNMLMQCAAVRGNIATGFELLRRAEARGLPHSDSNCYRLFRTLIEACRAADDSDGASRVQAAVDRLGLIALAPLAVALVQGSERTYDNRAAGEGAADARILWLKLRQLTAYTAQVQALPWNFVQHSSLEEQEGSLQLHAEKKALAVLLAQGEPQPEVSINFNACTDCHEFFKSSSLLMGRTIHLRQPRMVHTFIAGNCSCKDRWRWEARLAMSFLERSAN